MINVEIKSIVNNLGRDVEFLQPLYESIMNSFEAGAKNVVVTLFESEVIDPSFEPSITGFSIEDDGEGFTKKNRDSFCTLWSDYKYDLGCKGSGRFTWLNVFSHILITSYSKAEKKKIVIPFSIDFSKDDINIADCDDLEKSSTIIEFKGVTSKYYKVEGDKKIDKRAYANVEKIKEKVLDYLFVNFWFLKTERKDFCLTIKTSKNEITIKDKDIEELYESSFEITDSVNGNNYIFYLRYAFKKDNKGVRKIVLCSSKRSTHKVNPSSVNLCGSLPNNDSLYMFISSDYLDDIDTDDRKGLDEYASSKDATLLHPISYEELLYRLSREVKHIVGSNYPEVEGKNNAVVEEVIAENPHLSKYIDTTNTTIASKKTIESEARKAFEKDKIQTSERFEKALEDRAINPVEYQEAIAAITSISAAELCEYIVYRSKIINALSKSVLIDKDESYLHNIFMPMHSSNLDDKKYYNTNMWLLDDKFMSYLYASSDLSILNINRDISESFERDRNDRRRPDMFVAFDREDGKRNVVLIEFKAYSASLDEKRKSLTELPDNIATIRNTNHDIKTIWAYIITKLDDNFTETIKNTDNYELIPTTNDEYVTYYHYNKYHNAHIYIVDIDAIVSDAETRNKVFMDILGKH